MAQALLEPAMAEVAWQASGGMKPRVRGADDAFCHRLGERVGRTWLGPELAADHGTVAEVLQQGAGHLGGGAAVYTAQLHQLFARLVDQLRDPEPLFGAHRGPPPGPRAAHLLLCRQDAQLAGHRGGLLFPLQMPRILPPARRSRLVAAGAHDRALPAVQRAADLIDQALVHTAAAAVAAGVALEEVAQWSGLPAEELAAVLALGEGED
ncbi:hypothetical protein AB0E04_42235 [Streptomyces sp. NPDC048251]|uniref:hypothetical protein n=1 Tax=Streptomyces sp. NPDC048251 TaxID=3154501 RepID=UPI00342D2916